ncbi:hypothetical protein ACCUM_3037 [Candidatus Accumulibacter phosphatis]|uniref:Uncharacterized protein n=1 Tax=Candidatus Accumulibacter phosphatis TaxID=327160 RepID=A0A5S4F9M4_9PROT|nr:hypothetical protein ACCUM_3037 [Candidatus Accumulibacter phosphatis]
MRKIMVRVVSARARRSSMGARQRVRAAAQVLVVKGLS